MALLLALLCTPQQVAAAPATSCAQARMTPPRPCKPPPARAAKPVQMPIPVAAPVAPPTAIPALLVPKAALATMEPLFRRLTALEHGPATDPLLVIQIGDSHSAGDFLSARLRELFQDRFGAIGRGLLPPGIADRYYNPRLIAVQASPGWIRAAANQATESGLFGIAGIRQDTGQGGETMSLRSDEAEGFDKAYLTLLRRPGGGSITLRMAGAEPRIMRTDGTTEMPLWLDLPVAPGTREISLETMGDGPVSVLSWGAHRLGKGVLYANFGVIGARVDMLERVSPEVLATEWRQHRPGLIVVIFGTNEAFGPEDALTEYAQAFEERVALLAAAAPGAALLIIGPPDGNRRGSAGRVCGPAPAQRVAGRAPAHARAPAYWARPAQLDLVSAAQRAVAARRGWLFWDWSAAMGGPCAMHAWTQPSLQLGQADHIHLTQAGYQFSAERLFADLMARYASWRGTVHQAR